mgnify:CR=1 FL=1
MPTPWLDGRHVVFGRVLAGLHGVRDNETVRKAPGERPLETVVIATSGLLSGAGNPDKDEL